MRSQGGFIGSGRSMVVEVHGGDHGDQILDYAARVQRLVAAWCLTGSGQIGRAHV